MTSRNFLSETMAIVGRYKLPYQHINETPADGNCFFNAIIDQCKNNSEIYETIHERAKPSCLNQMSLRQALILFMDSKDPSVSTEHFRTYVSSYLSSIGKTWSEVMQEMSQSGTWADDLFVAAMAMFLNKDIYLLTNTNPAKEPWTKIQIESSSYPPITLVYLTYEHFQSIHKIQSAQNQCYCCGREAKQSILSHLAQKPGCQSFYDMDQMRKSKPGKKAVLNLSATGEDVTIQNCLGCGTQVQQIMKHLGKRPDCKKHYDIDTLRKIAKQNHRERQKAYVAKNKELLRQKHHLYNESHREEIRQKQAVYYRAHQEEIRQKMAVYNKEHQEEIRQKQALYHQANREQIRQKQAVYDQAHREKIRLKQAAYNKANRELIRQKQAAYNKANRELIRQKQFAYYQKKREQIDQGESAYNEPEGFLPTMAFVFEEDASEPNS